MILSHTYTQVHWQDHTLPVLMLLGHTCTWSIGYLNQTQSLVDSTTTYGCTVSDCSRVTYTPTPSPNSHSSLSCALRFLGFYRSTSKRLTTSSVESVYRNFSSMYDDQPSVWGVLTSSRFISLSFITLTPSHFLSLTLAFSIIINTNHV